MFGILLAVVVFCVFFLIHLGVSHRLRLEKKEAVLVGFMAAAALTYLALFAALRDTLTTRLSVSLFWADVLTGLAALGFLLLGYVEFWSLIERSFSLRILIDVAESPAGLTRSEMAANYSGGRGLDWMMEKRVEDLVGTGMLVPVRDSGSYYLSRRGRIVAAAFRVLQKIFAIT